MPSETQDRRKGQLAAFVLALIAMAVIICTDLVSHTQPRLVTSSAISAVVVGLASPLMPATLRRGAVLLSAVLVGIALYAVVKGL
jgi:hypothetical protein